VDERTTARFWSKVEKTSACWHWHGTRLANGYGQFRLGGPDHRRVPPHRLAYELLVGPVPDGLVLDHLCRIPLCVNPMHLEPVTQRENMRRARAVSPKMQRRAACVHGHSFFDPENVYVTPDGRRQCRACHYRRQRRRYLRSKGLS
jgi:hypothetical protein